MNAYCPECCMSKAQQILHKIPYSVFIVSRLPLVTHGDTALVRANTAHAHPAGDVMPLIPLCLILPSKFFINQHKYLETIPKVNVFF